MFALAAFGDSNAKAAKPEQAISRAARALYRRAVVLDGNLGLPAFDDLPIPPEILALIRQSGVNAVKTTIGGSSAPFEEALSEVAFFQRTVERHPDAFMQIRHVDDIVAAKRAGKLGIIFSFESATCLEDKLDRIDLFRNFGVRVMQLSYNTQSPFGAGVMSSPDAGLTELGRQAIERMNAQGVALDLSHANAATTNAAIAASRKPVLITHGGCAALHPHPRNKTDAQLRAVAAKGGVFGIYNLFYLVPSPRQPTVDDYVSHVAHALSVCGEDHVGIGSDTSFDAVDTSPEARVRWDAVLRARRESGAAAPEEDRLPYVEGMNRPDRALIVADALLKRGYSERVVEKVLGANFVRAFQDIW